MINILLFFWFCMTSYLLFGSIFDRFKERKKSLKHYYQTKNSKLKKNIFLTVLLCVVVVIFYMISKYTDLVFVYLSYCTVVASALLACYLFLLAPIGNLIDHCQKNNINFREEFYIYFFMAIIFFFMTTIYMGTKDSEKALTYPIIGSFSIFLYHFVIVSIRRYINNLIYYYQIKDKEGLVYLIRWFVLLCVFVASLFINLIPTEKSFFTSFLLLCFGWYLLELLVSSSRKIINTFKHKYQI